MLDKILINLSYRHGEIKLTFPSNSDDPAAGFIEVCIDVELDSSSTELRSTRAILEANSSDKLSSSESSSLLCTWNTRLSISVEQNKYFQQNNLGQYRSIWLENTDTVHGKVIINYKLAKNNIVFEDDNYSQFFKLNKSKSNRLQLSEV